MHLTKQSQPPDDQTKGQASDIVATLSKLPYVPNKIPGHELFRAFVLTPLCLWFSLKFLADGKAIISFSKRATHHIEVAGPWSSLLGAIGMLLTAALFASIVADHFDHRPNEHLYSRFAKSVSILSLAAFVLACFVGWQFEHIQWVKKA